MNKEAIEKINKVLKYANEYATYLEEKGHEVYKECGFEYEHIIPKKYDVEDKIKDFEYIKKVLEKLDEEKIDLNEKYFITDNIYLSIFLWNNEITFHFYIENDDWLYENYIDSHSGLNEWIDDYVNELYELYSGNSRYCYAFGTVSLNDYKRTIENKEHKNTVEQVVKNIKTLINYFTDEENETRNAIVEEINNRINKLHELVEKVEE